MIPRPFACDGSDCDYNEYGAWRHAEGCLYWESEPQRRLDAYRDALAADGYALSSKGYRSLPQQRTSERGAA